MSVRGQPTLADVRSGDGTVQWVASGESYGTTAADGTAPATDVPAPGPTSRNIGVALDDLQDVDLFTTPPTTGQQLTYNGLHWAPAASDGHTHAAADIVSGTFADAQVAASNVTQHQASLSITESQISDLTHTDTSKLPLAGGTMTGTLTLDDGTTALVSDASGSRWASDNGTYYINIDDTGITQNGLSAGATGYAFGFWEDIYEDDNNNTTTAPASGENPILSKASAGVLEAVTANNSGDLVMEDHTEDAGTTYWPQLRFTGTGTVSVSIDCDVAMKRSAGNVDTAVLMATTDSSYVTDTVISKVRRQASANYGVVSLSAVVTLNSAADDRVRIMLRGLGTASTMHVNDVSWSAVVVV